MSLTQAVFSQILPKALPAEMEYTVPKESVHAERQTTKFLPSGGYAEYIPGSTCQISLPAIDAMMDTHSTWFKFGVSLPDSHLTGTQTYYTGSAGAHGFIQSVRVVHSSGTVLDTIEGYNILRATQLGLTVPQDYLNVLGLQQGIGGVSLGGVVREFMIPIKNVIFANMKHIPLKYLGQVRLEIVFAHAHDALVRTDPLTYDDGLGNATAPQTVLGAQLKYTIHDACIYTSLIKLSDTQIASYDEVFRQRGLRLYGEGYAHHYLTWVSNKATLSVADRTASMKDVTIVTRSNASLSPSVHNLDKLTMRTNKVQSYQFSLAGRLFPSRPVDGPVEALSEAMDALHGNMKGWQLTPDSWTRQDNSSFVIMRELETSRSLVSGDSTCRDKQVDLQITLEGKAGLTPDDTVDVFIQFDKVLEFLPTGQVGIYE